VRVVLFLSVALAALSLQAQTPAPARREPPRLVVLMAVDQFRADYVQMYGRHWKAGLRRLVDKGAYFTQAAYPYATTLTCVGHSTIGTGALPKTHGMVGNTFYDRALGKPVACTDDPSVTPVPIDGPAGEAHDGPGYFRAPTLADELRRQAAVKPHVVSLSLKADAAIGLAGHGGDGTIVVWKDGNGSWSTSTAYTDKPWKSVSDYIKTHAISSSYGQVWTRLLPDSAYQGPDDGVAEASTPWARTFPHVLESRSGRPDAAFSTAWRRSPFSDEYLEDLAATLIDREQLGRHPGTDVLAISFSALDLVGHGFGPASHEVQDVLLRLDVMLGKLFDKLDKTVGPGRWTLGMSADHGVAPIPEQVPGGDAGRISPADIFRKIDAALTPVLGAGAHLAGRPGSEMNFTFGPGVYDRIRSTPGARRVVEDALFAAPGVGHAYWADDMAGANPTDDAGLRAARLSYYAGRSGDLLVTPRPFWITAASGTTHGTPNDYDRRVPVIFFGAGIKPGEYLAEASPADIAPTLASLVGVTLAHADGRVLTAAIVR
jgi:predicted AlkP superfamily pyrophosphatase or phosphodiesterase